MSDQDPRPTISKIDLPHRLRRDGWWLEECPACRDFVRAASKLVLIKGRQQKEDDHCKDKAR